MMHYVGVNPNGSLQTSPVSDVRNVSRGQHVLNPSSSDALVMYRKWIEGFILLFYSIVFLFGLTSNLVLTYLILTRKFMNKYVFTASISVAHIIVCIVVIPLVVIHCITSDARTEKPCHVIICFTVGVTSYSMLATAVRRYLALHERFRHRNFTERGKFMNLFAIWILSLVISIPLIFSKEPSMYNILPSVYFQVMRRGHHYETTIADHEPVVELVSDEGDVDSYKNLQASLHSNWSVKSVHSVNSDNTDVDLSVVNDDEGNEFEALSAMWTYSVVLLVFQVVVPCILSMGLQIVSYRGILHRPNQTHWVKELNITRQHMFMIALFAVCFVTLMFMNLLDVLRHFSISPFLIRCFQPLAVSLVMYFPIIYYFQNAYIKREFLLWLAQVTGRPVQASQV